MISFVSLVTVGALLLAGALSDLVRRRVPNLVSGGVAVAGLGVQFSRGAGAAALALLAGLLVGAVLTLFWRARLIGGGDVKLSAAAAVCVGWSAVPLYLLATAVAGGLASLAIWLASAPQERAQARANLAALALGLGAGRAPAAVARPVPYGVAIAAGALIALWRS